MKKIVSTVLAVSMLASMAMPVFAADITTAGSTGTTNAVVTAAPITFNVTVPTELPVNIDASGVVTTGVNAKIVNNSAGAVLVTGVTFTPSSNWKAVSYDKDMSAIKVDTKEVGFTINECKTGEDGALVFNQLQFPSIAAKNESATDELALTYSMKVPAQKTALENVKVGDVVFTVGWDAVA